MRLAHHAVSGKHRWNLNVVVDRVNYLATEGWFVGAWALHGRAGRNVAKVLGDHRLGLCHVDVARNRKGCVVGHIVLFVEGHELLEGRSIQVVHGTDRNPTVVVLLKRTHKHF